MCVRETAENEKKSSAARSQVNNKKVLYGVDSVRRRPLFDQAEEVEDATVVEQWRRAREENRGSSIWQGTRHSSECTL